MATLTPAERLQPALLDRLTDDARDQVQESAAHRVISPEQLRSAVVRDLAWLLNTDTLAAAVDLHAYPNVADSVLNYGLASLAGRQRSGLIRGELETLVRAAILRFEPRIVAKSLKVKVMIELSEMAGRVVQFEISGLLWQQPVPEQFQVHTDMDLDTGYMAVREPTER
jgi:type VI secretion system protein ImpF